MESNERVEEEEIWSWGAGTEGQLGTGNLQDEYFPRLLPIHPLLSFLSCGGAHVIAITTTKKTFTWGRGTSGQLGHGNLLNTLQPKSVDVLDNLNLTNVSAGWNHSGFVSGSDYSLPFLIISSTTFRLIWFFVLECGQLFTCGDGSFGQLGLGDYGSQNFPIKVSHFASMHVEQIACGMRHSLVLLKGEHREQVYGFGSGKRGQLGISNEKVKSINLPQSVFGLNEVNVSSISANGDHSAALSCE